MAGKRVLKSKFDGAVRFMHGKVVERHATQLGGVWGIFSVKRTYYRVRPQFGLDIVQKRTQRWMRVRRILNAAELERWLAAKAAPKDATRLEAAVRSAAKGVAVGSRSADGVHHGKVAV